MDNGSRNRRPTGSLDAAEAAFKKLTTKPVEAVSVERNTPPGIKEQVTLRLDADVLAHFQDDGPGWQDRINAALRKAAGL